jgi:LysR family transcriptional activator of glutamate synthase operon
MTKAAEELHVAQSAISRQIRQLEEEMGAKLFVHKGRNLVLTQAGEMFLKRADQLLADIEDAVAEVREFVNPERGEIKLGFPHSLGISLIPTIVAEFRMVHPHVRIRFKQGHYPTLISDVLAGDLDIAFISPFPSDMNNMAGKILTTEELYAILPPDHRLAQEDFIDLAQLKNEDFVLYTEGYSLRKIVVDACTEAGFTPHIAFEGEETEQIRGLVAAGMGVSLLPDMALSGSFNLGPAKVRLRRPNVTRTIGIVHRADRKMSMVSEMFENFVFAYFNNNSILKP